MGKRINEIINKSIKQNTLRIKYLPYKLDIAKKYWLQSFKEIIDCDILDVDDNIQIWEKLIKYVHADTCEYDLNKAIGIIGRTGSGKSVTMETLTQYIKYDNIKYIKNDKYISFNFKIVNALELVSEFEVNGFEGVNMWYNYNIICIDDLGAEIPEVMHYGTKVNVIEDIIEQRYMKGLMTHFTSNLDMQGILERYGDRVYSRLKGSTNVLTMNKTDYRIKT